MFRLRWYLLALAVLAALILGSARPSSGSTRDERYVVRPGDTLWALAADRYGGDPREAVWRIEQRNGLPDAGLWPGMVLYLPARGGDA